MEFIATAMKTITLPFERKITGKSFNDKKNIIYFLLILEQNKFDFLLSSGPDRPNYEPT